MSAVLWYHQRKSFVRLAVILILLLSATVVILFGDVLFLAQRNAFTSSADDVEREIRLGDLNEADENRNEEVESKQVEESMVPGNTLGEEYLNIMEREEEKEEEEIVEVDDIANRKVDVVEEDTVAEQPSSSTSLSTSTTTTTTTKAAKLTQVQKDTLEKLVGVEFFDGLVPPDYVPQAEYKSPCWSAGDRTLQCMPFFYVLGHWQSGGQDLIGRLVKHPNVIGTRHFHFWNEPRPPREYSQGYGFATETIRKSEEVAKDLIFGDDSPGTFANSWSESTRLHLSFAEDVQQCWTKCQEKSNETPEGKTQTERRRCIDGDLEDQNAEPIGCGRQAMKNDPPSELGGHGMSVPHLMRYAYDIRDSNGENTASRLKFILVLREPAERLHDAFWHYDHYQKYFGASEDGFDKFATEMMGHFKLCESEHSTKGCARRFETYHPKFEAVFFHADQLIKNMYSVWLERWFQVFDKEQFLFLRSEDVFGLPNPVSATPWDYENNEKKKKRGMSEALRKISKHLNIGEITDAMLEQMIEMPETDDARVLQKGKISPMRKETRELLNEFYQPFLEELADNIGDEAFLWDGFRR
jgi:N-acetylgalactosamine 4-sulfate 6-O-sulfotransferase